jgi:hypothetical protein
MVLLDAPSDPNPYTAYVGSSTNGRVFIWDYVPTVTTSAAVDGTAANPVVAELQTKFYKVGAPGTNKALQRFYPEFLIAGAFTASVTLQTDYGSVIQIAQSTAPNNTEGILNWAVGDPPVGGDWAVGDPAIGNSWAVMGNSGFSGFNAPESRIDYPGVQGEAFAFGVLANVGQPPWIFSGGTGVFDQRGKT